ncbi:hypothetical protein [Streptomyces hirsutus]|uniref:hypothetical protein n=1 Tax=Streptomyces hirsutus TaxID=35620 RepID=UPI00368C31FA
MDVPEGPAAHHLRLVLQHGDVLVVVVRMQRCPEPAGQALIPLVIRFSPPADGVVSGGVVTTAPLGPVPPGERSAATAAEDGERGVPVTPEVWREPTESAAGPGVTPPEPRP